MRLAGLSGGSATISRGAKVSTDRVCLVLLAVLVSECGGGLALAVGMSLSEDQEQSVREPMLRNERSLRSTRSVPDTVNGRKELPRTRSEPSPNSLVFAPVRYGSRKAGREALIMVLRERGGPLRSMRRLAQHLETSPTMLHTVVGELIAEGTVSVVTGRQGSVSRRIYSLPDLELLGDQTKNARDFGLSEPRRPIYRKEKLNRRALISRAHTCAPV
jgi:hypothetical protein